MTHTGKCLIAGVLLHGATLGAQEPGTIRGTISDSLTGAPVLSARAAVLGSGRYGRERSDPAGRYVLDRVPAGTWVVEFHCPSRTSLGRKLTKRTVTVPAGGEAVVDVQVPPGGCFEPDSGSRVGVFRGYYSFGFEESSFVPCPDSSRGLADGLLPGEHVFEPSAWVTFSPAAGRQRVRWPPVPAGERYPRYLVRWRGTLTGPGTYGHMGVAAFAFVVDSVLEVRPAGRAGCE